MVRRVEAAVAKSEYSQGKKIKVVTKVCCGIHMRVLAGCSAKRINLRPNQPPVNPFVAI
jgi:hypothetical protein